MNSVTTNPGKFQTMILSKSKSPKYIFLIDSNVRTEFPDIELLGLITDNKPSFNSFTTEADIIWKPVH